MGWVAGGPYGSFPKVGAVIQTPNSKACIIRTPSHIHPGALGGGGADRAIMECSTKSNVEYKKLPGFSLF